MNTAGDGALGAVSRRFSTTRKLAAFTFLCWALGCAAMLWVQYSFLSPGTPISFLFTDDFLLRSNSYLVGSGVHATAAAALLVVVGAPGRMLRWTVFASTVSMAAIAFTFRGVHSAVAFAVMPVLVCLRLALMESADRGVAPEPKRTA